MRGLQSKPQVESISSDYSRLEMGEQEFPSAESCYGEGNDRFRSGNFHSAIESYSAGINDYCCQKTRPPDSSAELYFKMLLNRAQCYLNEREYASAVKDCTVLITLDSSCVKAYIRRALAYENLGNFRKGLSDIESAASLQPPACLMETIVKLSSRLRALAVCDEKAIAAEGNQPLIYKGAGTI